MTDDDSGLWVQSDALPTGGYGATINVGADRAWTLNADQAARYALTCIRRATEAEHDAAVFSLLVDRLDLGPADAAQLLGRDLRPMRPPPDDTATAPLRFMPGVSHRSRAPFLAMFLDDKPIGQLDPAALRHHATSMLDVVVAAELDSTLARCLVEAVGVDDGIARAAVGSLYEHWPGT